MAKDLEINKDSLRDFLLKTFPLRERAPDNEYANLVSALYREQITLIRELDDFVDRYLGRFIEYEGLNPPPGYQSKYYDTGAIVTMLSWHQKEQ